MFLFFTLKAEIHFTTKRRCFLYILTREVAAGRIWPAVRASASRAASGPRQSLAEEEEMQHSVVDRASLVFGVSKKWNAPCRPGASSASADCPGEFVAWSRRGGTKRGRAVSGVQVFLSFVGAMKACSAAPSGGLVQRFAATIAFLVQAALAALHHVDEVGERLLLVDRDVPEVAAYRLQRKRQETHQQG